MNIELKYGKTKIEIPYKGLFDLLEISDPVFSIVEKDFQDELKGLIDDNKQSIAIVLADKTRLCEYTRYLPVLINVLLSKGYNTKNITFYIFMPIV